MKYKTLFLMLAFLLLSPLSGTTASTLHFSAVAQVADGHPTPPKVQKVGFFQQIRAVKALKKHLRTQGKEGEKASKMARFALGLFIVSYVVAGLLSTILPFFLYIALAGIATSLLLSAIVLAKEDNRKSRKIARTVLIVTGIIAGGLAVFVLGAVLYYSLA